MPPKPQQKRRPLEETTEPLAGKIVFVPPKNRITARLKPDLERTGYNHPGVIISSRPDGVGRVKIAMLTSFKDTPVAYVLDREEDYAHYLPIDDALHPISSIRRLKRRPESPSLRKKSYVYIGENHTIPYKALEPYGRSSRYSAGPWLCEKSVRILQSHFGEPLDDYDEDDDISCTDTSDGECDLGEADPGGEGQLAGWHIDVELDSVSIGQSTPLPLQLTLVAGPSAASILGSEGSSSDPPTPTERSLSISRLSSSSLSFSEFPPYCDEYATFHQPQHAVSPSLPTQGDCALKQTQTTRKILATHYYPLLIITTMIALGPHLVGDGSCK
ncbi:hypothetical protein CCHR01_00798 [Colletotrichum chrysophilum]|uniref:Uncharacterized protein n=2 Tax=Colletotrichum gloeosporioides species complex TaxID=2707338 RepID=L2FH08_COLFN|nr:hypothetical protein CCHR01_00798 [Colletotrichum chrysophilum]